MHFAKAWQFAQTQRHVPHPTCGGCSERPCAYGRTEWRLVALACILAISWAQAAAAQDDLAKAHNLWLKGKYAEAEAAFQQLSASAPAEAALGLARCQSSRGRYADAHELLEAAIVSHPQAAALHAELAELAMTRGDFERAARAIDEALKAHEENLHARWLQAELARWQGRLDDADRAYGWLVAYYNAHDVAAAADLRYIGLGAAQYARWHRLSDQFSFLVNELYPDALAQEPAYWPAHYEAGLLYLEKYNQPEAERAFKAALAINPNAAEVYAALAQLALQNYRLEDAQRLAAQALDLNPNLLAAHWCRADAHLANFQTAEALEILQRALQLNPHSEGTLGRLAAAYAVLDGIPEDPAAAAQGRFGRVIEQAVQRNPHAGEFFFALATALDTTRRFPAAARYYQESIRRMPQLVAPRGALGLMYLRLGEEGLARQMLEESFQCDPFNVRVKNSLEVLDVLDGYAVLETEHFVLKFDRGTDALLARCAARYLEEEVYPQLTRQFGFEPEGKTLFEFFSRHRNTSGHGWFSARMVGLPYIGTVGACAGKMVALASPNDMPKKYNWARVLKHEFVHVLNLQQSRFNIPHWFTEALAVESEGYPRPQTWNELLAERVPRGELFNLDTINLGFIRPSSSLDWQMAYCQAQLYAQYMVATYGEDALARMLAAYRDNLDTRAALERCFGVSQQEFERGYLEFIRGVAAGLTRRARPAAMTLAQLVRAQREHPDDPDLTSRLALAQFSRKAYPQARSLAEQVLAAHPAHPLASYVLARIRLLVGEEDQALALLEAAFDPADPEEHVLALLASLRVKAEQYQEAERLYALAAASDPHNVQWLKSLAGVYLKTRDHARLGEVLVKLAQADADDLLVRKKLAQLAVEARRWDDARRWASEVLHIDVQDPEAHAQLAQSLSQLAQHARAAEEYEMAVQLAPDQLSWRLAWAEACHQAGNDPRAREILTELLALQPDFPGAKDLLEKLQP
jgi:tetratricopeptide (TPR) repeat protein